MFYDSLWGGFCVVVVIPFWVYRMRRLAVRQEKSCKERELKEFLQLLSMALQAGFAVEQAFVEVEKELRMMHGKDSRILPLLVRMNRRVALNRPAEEEFLCLAKKLGLEDGLRFGYIFQASRRLGSDQVRLLENAAGKLEEKIRIQQENQILVAQKQLELQVMYIMPLLIVAYVKCTSYDFLAVLYHNLQGVFIMSLCLVAYGGMILLGEWILQIDV